MSLNDKKIKNEDIDTYVEDFYVYLEEDVKQAIKRVLERSLINLKDDRIVTKLSVFKEIFGEELCTQIYQDVTKEEKE